MAAKGYRKLVDILDIGDCVRLYRALENFLEAHTIPYKFQDHWDDGFRRYFVESKNLCCARSVLPALQQIAEGDGPIQSLGSDGPKTEGFTGLSK